MPDTFNVRDWLNNHFPNAEFNRNEVNPVTDFSLMWNHFENILGERNINITRLEAIATDTTQISGDSTFYQNYFDYFKNRYIKEDNTTNELFENLSFRPGDKKDFVATVLKGDDNNAANTIEAILIIIYRIRNNFFHGEKQLHNIYTQYDNFNIANKFLAEILTINNT
ncbi:hypothetical protein ACFLQ4_01955 [Bacteroidota bacterium]